MNVIEARGLWKSYIMGNEKIHALAGVDVTVEKGEYLAIMGPSGSGKSTLMNLIGCLDTPTKGSYRLNGREVSTMTDDELAMVRNREIGFIFQTFQLLPRTRALRNVELPLVYQGLRTQERQKLARQALERIGLGNRVEHRPNELSGGQRQRVAIARALVNEPSIVLADEPTGNLDTVTGSEILTLFDELHAQGHTLIVITHEKEVADRAKRVTHLRDGRIDFQSG